jgi:hypothetical protein
MGIRRKQGLLQPYSLHVSPLFLQNFSRECLASGRLPPLPNLRVLKLQGDPETTPHLFLILLSSKLTTVNIICDPSLKVTQAATPTSLTGSNWTHLNVLKPLEERQPNLISLRLSGAIKPQVGIDPFPQELNWSAIFPDTLNDLLVEREALERPHVANRIRHLPNLRRLEVHTYIQHRSYQQGPKIQIAPLPSLQELLCSLEVLREIFTSIPTVRKLIVRVYPWDLGSLARDGMRTLRPSLEKSCPALDSFTVLLRRLQGRTCGTAIMEMSNAVRALEATWEKLDVQYEPR